MKEKINRLNAVIKNYNSGELYIFGAGRNGKELLIDLNSYHVEVSGFIDNNHELKTVHGKGVISFQAFLKSANKNDFVLISCADHNEIEEQMQNAGWENYMYYGDVPDLKEYVIDYDMVQTGKRTCWEKAISWLLAHKIPGGGISYSSKEAAAYPEVTGYLVPTLVSYGYYSEAKDCVKWLLSIQQEDGGFTDLNHTKEFVFDTAQILRGFLCFYEDYEIGTQVINAIVKICDFLYHNMIDAGKGGYIRQYEHDLMIPESILLYTLPPFKKAAELLGREDYLEAIGHCMVFYEGQERFLLTEDLTHFLAYEIEALIDLGMQEKIQGVLEKIWESQMENGAIPSHKNSKWICTPGAAQLALCELKLGKLRHAEKILEWMRKVQLPQGGFFGAYGSDAWYFVDTEIAWAVKYFLDAEKLYIEKYFDWNADDFPEDIERTDMRYQVVLEEAIKLSGNTRIAEVGCGKGRFLRNLLTDGFHGGIDGIDISVNMLSCLPDRIGKIHGRMENIPCEDNIYDFVFCVEALEHSQNMQSAISEMVRILKPGGTLLIIDKDKTYWGLMKCAAWENWIGREELKQCMDQFLINVQVSEVDEKNPYMLVWRGQKFSKEK